MTNTHPQAVPRWQDKFGRRVAARLTGGTAELPHHITERLRAGREQAVARRKPLLGMQAAHGYALAGPGVGSAMPGFWPRLATAVPIVVLLAGLVAIHLVQNEHRASEVAEIDAALLTDALPPAAYADPGFLEFLRHDR